MKVEAHDRLGNPVAFPATRVVVYTDDNHPICITVQVDKNQYHSAHVGDEEFDTLVDLMGIESKVVVKPLKGK